MPLSAFLHQLAVLRDFTFGNLYFRFPADSGKGAFSDLFQFFGTDNDPFDLFAAAERPFSDHAYFLPHRSGLQLFAPLKCVFRYLYYLVGSRLYLDRIGNIDLFHFFICNSPKSNRFFLFRRFLYLVLKTGNRNYFTGRNLILRGRLLLSTCMSFLGIDLRNRYRRGIPIGGRSCSTAAC